MLIAAHSELLCAGLHTATHHQPIPRLEDVQRAGHSRVGHCANKYRDVLCKTTKEETEDRKKTDSMRDRSYKKRQDLICYSEL